jgi:hypothetical protein
MLWRDSAARRSKRYLVADWVYEPERGVGGVQVVVEEAACRCVALLLVIDGVG